MENKKSWALITGASMGLGKAFAAECAARGMNLLLVALPGSGLPEVAAAIERDRGVSALWLEADLTESTTLDRVLDLVRSEGIVVDLLVNNAGIGSVGLFMDRALAHHEDTIGLNVLALVRLTRLVVAEFRGRANCRILNVASLGSFFPMPTLAIYSATKSFVLDFSLALRAELEGSMSVSVLCPNAIRTTESVDDYLDRFGLLSRLACMTPDKIARIALDGLDRRKAVIIPGLFNRVLATLSRFVPMSLSMRLISRCWGGFESACTDAETANLAGERAGAV